MANPEIDIDYMVGGATAQKLISMAASAGGPLRATHDHLFAKMIGGYTSGNIELLQRELEYINLGAMTIAPDLLHETQPWHVLPSRWKQHTANLVAAGISKACVHGIDNTRIVVSEIIPTMPPPQQVIARADVGFDGAATGWVAGLTAHRAKASDKNNDVFVSIRAQLPGLWTAPGRAAAEYTEMEAGIITELCDASATDGRKVAAAITFFRNTRVVPPRLITYFAPEDCWTELQRRIGDSAETRFRPLFEVGWARAYPQLARVWDPLTEGSVVADEIKSLFLRLSMATRELTHDTVAAFSAAVAPKLFLLDVPSITNITDQSKANAARADTLITALGGKLTSAQGGGSGTGSASERGGDVAAALGKHPAFNALTRELEQFRTLPIDLEKATRVLAKSESPAGIITIAGTKLPVAQFDNVTGTMITRSTQSICAVLNRIVRIDKSGALNEEWPCVVTKELATKIVQGKATFGDGKGDTIFWWREFTPIMKLRATAFAFDRKLKLCGDPSGNPYFIFLSPDHMKMLRPLMAKVFEFLGYDNAQAGNFEAVWDNMMDRTEELLDIPDTNPDRMGLLIKHVASCAKAFSSFWSKWQSMLATPPQSATKPRRVMSKGDDSFTTWESVGSRITTVLSKAATSNGHTSNSSALEIHTLEGQVANTPTELCEMPEGKAVLAWFGWKPKGKRKATEADDDDDSPTKHKKSNEKDEPKPLVFPKGSSVEQGWGNNAHIYGVFRSTDFSKIWFGDRNCVEITDGEKPTADTKCFAPWFTGGNWHAWCCDPGKCDETHGKAAVIFSSKDTLHAKGEATKRPSDAVVVCKPNGYPGSGAGGGGRGGAGGSAGRGRGGKGKGSGAKGSVKGKGKGGKRGKGARKEVRPSHFQPLSSKM